MKDQWQIDFYTEVDGTLPVKEFLENSSLKPGELKQLALRLKLLRGYGLRLLKERSDILDKIATEKNLYELRIDNTPNNPRIFLCAFTGKRFFLLHGFKKKSRKTPKSEINIAAKRRDQLIVDEEG